MGVYDPYQVNDYISKGSDKEIHCSDIFSITTVTAIKRGDNKPFYYSPLVCQCYYHYHAAGPMSRS